MQIVIKIQEDDFEKIKNTSFVENTEIMFHQSSEDRKLTMMLFRIMDAIKDGTPLPADRQQSAKTGWIPCSERMPEDGDTYIVSGYETWEGKKLPFVDCATYPGSYIDGWDTYNDWCEGQEVHIIAWQEMPEALEDEE